jgi:hypothetical protein
MTHEACDFGVKTTHFGSKILKKEPSFYKAQEDTSSTLKCQAQHTTYQRPVEFLSVDVIFVGST